MRGSLRTQITTALKTLFRPGLSRHDAKREFGRSPYIHAVGTLEKNFERLNPLAAWLKERGIKDLEALGPELVARYLADRLEHHLRVGNARKTFAAELSALAALERGLTLFSGQRRPQPVSYDFTAERNAVRGRLKALSRPGSGGDDRALADPEAVIAALENPKHRLMALLQLHCGCRAEGAGAPRRWHNPLRFANFCGLEESVPGEEWRTLSVPGELLPVRPDPVTGRPRQLFWTQEKGGKIALKFCPPDLTAEVLAWLDGGRRELSEDYQAYCAALNRAMVATGQAARGRGTHALRFCFARRRYRECLRHGLSDEAAKQRVSYEMSHNRPDITELYL